MISELPKLILCELDVKHQPSIKHALGKRPKAAHIHIELRITNKVLNRGGMFTAYLVGGLETWARMYGDRDE